MPEQIPPAEHIHLHQHPSIIGPGKLVQDCIPVQLLVQFFLSGYVLFHRHRSREVCLAQRYQRPMALLVLDVDSLSKINHLYGYPAGDEVLRQIALVCRSHMRETDILARVEADTFALLLHDADHQGAYLVAERIRQQVTSLSFNGQDACFSCTVSISGTPLSTEHGDLEQMLRAGQRLLHQQLFSSDRVVGFQGVQTP